MQSNSRAALPVPSRRRAAALAAHHAATVSRRAWLGGAAALAAGLALPRAAWTADRLDGHIAPEQRESLSRMIRQVLLDSLPATIEGQDDWGDTKSVFAGVKLFDGEGKLRPDKRTRDVNHGLWKKYRVRLVEPEKNLRFRIVDARSATPNRVEFLIEASSPLELEARIERWRNGIKLLNGACAADATIKATITGEVGYQLATRERDSVLVLDPQVKKTVLDLTEFDLRRFGKLEGIVVQEVGDWFTGALAAQLHRQEAGVAEKMNAALVKHQDKLALRLPRPSDLGWLKSFSWGD